MVPGTKPTRGLKVSHPGEGSGGGERGIGRESGGIVWRFGPIVHASLAGNESGRGALDGLRPKYLGQVLDHAHEVNRWNSSYCAIRPIAKETLLSFVILP